MIRRLVALAALAAGVVAVVVVLGGSSPYRITARFVDAGQLVKGGTVQVGGRTVGSIDAIRLSDNGLADLELSIDDDDVTPLRRGTTASIRTVGLTGVANRFVELSPGPSTGEDIPDGGVLSTAETRGIVDLDVLFNAFDPKTRTRLQRIIRNGADVFQGRTRAANEGLSYLNPALYQSAQLAQELVHDRQALVDLLDTGATTATALASRAPDIEQGITATATTLRAVASRRQDLADALKRAPALLERPDGILGGLRRTVTTARPALRDARPVAPRLVKVLRQLVPTGRQAIPVLRQTRTLLPPLITGLNGLPKLRSTAVPALRSTVLASISLLPIVDGLRPFTPEIVNGVVSGLGNRAAGYYDANGHFARIGFNSPPNVLTGVLNGGGDQGGFKTGRTFRCPGASTDPADDGSNPYVEDRFTCDPADGFGVRP